MSRKLSRLKLDLKPSNRFVSCRTTLCVVPSGFFPRSINSVPKKKKSPKGEQFNYLENVLIFKGH